MKRYSTHYDINGKPKGFSKAYYRLPADTISDFRDDASVKMKCSVGMFDAMRNGSKIISDENKVILEEMFREYNIDFETGEYKISKN